MIAKLSAKELDLLQRIDENEDLRPLFFRRVKGLKWFEPLNERGYFNPKDNPKPVPSKVEGYVNIPVWFALDYLVKTAPELSDKKNIEFAEKFLKILIETTAHAVDTKNSNYRTWWKFSKVISQIAYETISLDAINIIDYWLDDKYERDIVAQEIGEIWLPKLLQVNDNHALELAKRIIEILYKVIFLDRAHSDKDRREASLRFSYYHAQKITDKVAELAGEKLGHDVIEVFDIGLKYILEQLDHDLWSSIWQPSIEDHEQNKHHEDAENVLIQAYRNSMNGFMRANPGAASEHVKHMLHSEYQTIQRIAIHTITRNCHLFTDVIDGMLEVQFLDSNYRHEMWHFLYECYPRFSSLQKDKMLGLITSITREDEKGEYLEGASAYNKAIWFSAIFSAGDMEEKLYVESVELAKTTPDHPDFSSYTSSGWSVRKSPITLEELQSLTIDKLVQYLQSYRDPGEFDSPNIEGLVKNLKELVKVESHDFYLSMSRFINLDLAYLYEILEAYRDLWTEKANLPWDEVWSKLLNFCMDIISQDRFWTPENTKQREPFVANRYWIVSSIGRLIEAGTKSDEHAFSERYLSDAEEILAYLLERETGVEYEIDCDAVSKSINSPRGQCLEALINLTLRSCRIASNNNNSDHSGAWASLQHYYDSELYRINLDPPEYEFATLVTNYLPNFLYMSKDWVLNNLTKIFDQSNYLKWLCAMQGYAYVNTIYQEIYCYLKESGDLLKALDDRNLKERVKDKAIQNIAIAYLHDYESTGDNESLINTLIDRNDHREIKHLIWFYWTLRKKDNEKLRSKIYNIWPVILKNTDLTKIEGQRMASRLCQWSVFVDYLDEDRRQLLLSIAHFSEEDHNSYELLNSISEISVAQPFEAHEIWMKMLERSTPDYPEKAVRKLLSNLLESGHEGMRKAKEAVDKYLKKGNDRPSIWLKEIQSDIG